MKKLKQIAYACVKTIDEILDLIVIVMAISLIGGAILSSWAAAISLTLDAFPIKVRSANEFTHRYPPLEIKLVKPNGETIEATATLASEPKNIKDGDGQTE